MDNKDTGILIDKKNVELHRFYFKEMVRLIGVQVQYRAPRKDKTYNNHGELDTFFYEPIPVGVIFEEHPTIWTMRKLGWDVELQEGETLIHVPYDVPRLEKGGIFEIPSGIDNTPSRKFRILRTRMSMIYPSEIVCHIAPLWTSEYNESASIHKDNNFDLLYTEEDD